MSQKLYFPDDFMWGAASSSHQVEGNQKNDWSEWEPTVAKRLAREAPARLKDLVYNWPDVRDEAKDPKNYTSLSAVGHYTRYEEDIQALAELGLNTFEFSLEWSRIEPEPGIFNEEATQHYLDVIETCKKYNVKPIVTLHHFTNPLWFEGWHERHAPVVFEKYVQYVFDKLGTKVDYWITINEPTAIVFMRYLKGSIWPAWPAAENNVVRAVMAYRNLMRAHKNAYTYMKVRRPNAQIGFVHSWIKFKTEGKKPASKLLAKIAAWFNNSLIHRPAKKYFDFVALHYYLAATVKVGFRWPKHWISHYDQNNEIKTQKGWQVYSPGIYEAITELHQQTAKPVLVAENGISDASDSYRKTFIEQHLFWIHRAIEDGSEVLGYCYWSLLDNFEWSEGFWEKFGLFAVNRTTKERKPRDSAIWYGQVAQNGYLESSFED